MDTKRYCKACGHHINFEYGIETGYCPLCDKELKRADTVAGWTRDARIAQLKAMHTLMCNANDENIYMSWIYTVPDGATEEDFIDIALDEEFYNEVFDKFIKLIQKAGNRW